METTFIDWLKYIKELKGKTISEEKKEIVDYLLYEFVRWYEEESREANDISTLKFSLLFFLVIGAKEAEDLLDDMFPELWAEPYGIIDKQVKAYVKRCGLINDKTTILEEPLSLRRDRRVLNALRFIKNTNSRLIMLSSWDLMEIVRDRYSWSKTMYEAKKKGEYTGIVPTELIK